MNLVIVESPNKAKTISNYLKELDGNWEIMATAGHIKNLSKEYGISRDGDRFSAKWEIEPSKKKLVAELKERCARAEVVFLCQDDDREGEGIAFDVVEVTRIKNYKRIVFKDLSKKTILTLLTRGEESRPLSSDVARARSERRVLDRIIGYRMSELIRYDFERQELNLTPKGVGRVSFAALAILVRQQRIIDEFIPEERTKIYVEYRFKNDAFTCYLPNDFSTEDEHNKIIEVIGELRNGFHVVSDYKMKHVDRKPPYPLIASSLLAAGFNLLGMNTAKTAKVAQELFEGVEINGENVGLITYTRTDSYFINDETVMDLNELISRLVLKKADGPLGEKYVYEGKRAYKNRKNAQEAHEAIHPVSFDRELWPRKVKPYLTEEQFKLYRYIWAITVATQMSNSIYRTVKAVAMCDEHLLMGESEGRSWDGWEILMPEFTKHEENAIPKKSNKIPELAIGEELELMKIDARAKETEMPPRYGEGRFIKTLDSKSIGRPSTFPKIVSDLTGKDYVVRTEDGMLAPTKLAFKIVEWAEENAPWLVDEDHAREFEDKLSLIEDGQGDVKDALIKEYADLVDELIERMGYVPQDENSPPSEKEVKYALSLAKSRGEDIDDRIEDRKFIKAYIKKAVAEKTLHSCPLCKEGMVRENEKSFKCSNYTSCDFQIYKESSKKFFKNFDILLDDEDLREILTASLKKRYYTVKNMRGKNSTFNATIGIKKDKKYGWGFDFKEFVQSSELKDKKVFGAKEEAPL